MTTIYLAAILNPVSPRTCDLIPRGALAVAEDGRIADYGERDRVMGRISGHRIDLGRLMIMPGMIDAHVHLSQYDLTALEAGDLLKWLEKYIFPGEADLRDLSKAEDVAKRFFHDLKANGTTTACVHTTVDEDVTNVSFREAEKAGVRVVMGKVMTDLEVPAEHLEDTDESLASSDELCRKWHGRDHGRLQYSFIPRSAPGCTKRLLTGVGRLAKRNKAYIQTHLAESLEDLKWLRQAHGGYSSYVQIYRDCGILGAKTILAHSIYLSKGELKILAETDSRIAHCPSSNLFLKNGIMDLRERLSYGIKTALGSDVAGGPSLSLFREMAMAIFASKALSLLRKSPSKDSRSRKASAKRRRTTDQNEVATPTLAFYLATLGGARALNMEHKIGNFSKGKEADFIVIDPSAVDTKRGREPLPDIDRLLSQIIYRGDDRIVLRTFVRGREIYQRPSFR